MIESGYYPLGAEHDPKAPWNRKNPKPIEVNVCVSITMSKNTTIEVSDYDATEWEDSEVDEDGHVYKTGGVEYDFSNSDLKGAFNNQKYSIQDLLDVLKGYLQADIAGSFHTEGRQAKRILEECEKWNIDEFEVVEE